MKFLCLLLLRSGVTRVVFFVLLSSVVPGSSWASQNELTTAEPREVGLDENILNDLAARIRSNPKINIHSILIVKDNNLVFEEYFSGRSLELGTRLWSVVEHDKDTLHDLRSVSKSVTSALVGIAIAEGRIPGLDANAFDLFPDYSDQMAPDKRSLTLHHILTMSAGLDWFESDYTNPMHDASRMSNSPDPVAFTLGRSLESKPGERFKYNSGLPTLLGYLLERAYGKRGDEIVKEKLFDPLGIDGFEFHAMANGLLAHAWGLRLTPRDMAKFGMLYVNEGRWGEKQIIPAEWVEASFEPHIKMSRTSRTTPVQGYGYQWWLRRFESQENSIWVPNARGTGGQRIFILRPLNMVVVITAGIWDIPVRDRELRVDRVLTDYIFPAAGMDYTTSP